MSTTAPRKRRTTTEVNLAGDRWRRKAVNKFGSPNASIAENPRCAFLSRLNATLRCSSPIDAVRAAAFLAESGCDIYDDDPEITDDDDPGY